MTRSSHTLQLWSAAHKSGDDYYRYISDCFHNGNGIGNESAGLAAAYLNALRELERHLDTLDGSANVAEMRSSTAKFIELVLGDLKRFEETDRYELSIGKGS